MMLVRTRIGMSSIEGLGLFANETIPKGTPVWEFTPGFDLEFEPKTLGRLSQASKEQFDKYSYISKTTGRYILCGDDARFFNHSNQPNVSCKYPPHSVGEEGLCVAIQNIAVGEELTCDYREFDADPSTADFT